MFLRPSPLTFFDMNSFVELTFCDAVILECFLYRQLNRLKKRAANALNKTENPLTKPALQRRVHALEAGHSKAMQITDTIREKHRLPCGTINVQQKVEVATSLVGSFGNRYHVVTNSRQKDRMISKTAPERHETALELQVFFANEAARMLPQPNVVTTSRQEDRMISKTAPERHETALEPQVFFANEAARILHPNTRHEVRRNSKSATHDLENVPEQHVNLAIEAGRAQLKSVTHDTETVLTPHVRPEYEAANSNDQHEHWDVSNMFKLKIATVSKSRIRQAKRTITSSIPDIAHHSPSRCSVIEPRPNSGTARGQAKKTSAKLKPIRQSCFILAKSIKSSNVYRMSSAVPIRSFDSGKTNTFIQQCEDWNSLKPVIGKRPRQWRKHRTRPITAEQNEFTGTFAHHHVSNFRPQSNLATSVDTPGTAITSGSHKHVPSLASIDDTSPNFFLPTQTWTQHYSGMTHKEHFNVSSSYDQPPPDPGLPYLFKQRGQYAIFFYRSQSYWESRGG